MIAPGATVLRTSAQFMLRGLPLLTGRRSFGERTVRWLFADLARQDPSRVQVSLDRLTLTLQCLRLLRPIGPTVLKDRQLQSLAMPSLFVVGEHEKIYSAAKGVARLRRVAPEIRTEILPDAGHDINMAQADRVSRLVVEFLEGAPETL